MSALCLSRILGSGDTDGLSVSKHAIKETRQIKRLRQDTSPLIIADRIYTLATAADRTLLLNTRTKPANQD